MDNQKVVKLALQGTDIGYQAPDIGKTTPTLEPPISVPDAPAARATESGVIYDMLIQEGYLDEQKLKYAKRVHSKLTGDKTLTQVLQELGYITAEQLQETLSAMKVNLRIGTLLVELGLITDSQLEKAIQMTKGSSVQRTIGEVLVEAGFIEERSILEALSYQLELPYHELEISRMDAHLLRKIPPSRYTLHQFVPVNRKDDTVTVAFIDPLNRDSVNAAEKVFGKVRPVLCSKTDLEEVVRALEHEAALARLNQADEKTVAGLVNAMIEEAAANNVSDIHIEPMKDRVRVRFRFDGVLVHHKDFPLAMGPPLTNRIKVMAKADAAERKRHQGGRIEFADPLSGAALDVRVSFYVTVWGEKTVLRLPGRKGILLNLNEIGMYPKMLERFKLDALDMPSGVTLVTGPTGSGKTTTLYSCVNYLENVNTSIITVEDPVEYLIDGIAQCSIDPKIDLTFEESLKHAVRQDPDIIVIGEIRDRFSAETCIRASLIGHKVLSTFHAEDSIGGLIRLLNMNIEPFLISSTVVCVVAQRLLRRVCPKCSEDYAITPADIRRLGYSPNDARGGRFKLGRGCPDCRFTGYRGRAGVFELLVLNEAVKDSILNKMTSYEIRKISMETSGLVTLLEDGIMKAANGVTSIQEVFRSLPRVGKPRPIHELKRLLGAEEAIRNQELRI